MQDFEVPESDSGTRPGLDARWDLERKFWPAMGLYGVLAVAIWFTLGEGSIFVQGRPFKLRLIPLLVIGLFAFRTWLARESDRIRRRREEADKF